MHTGLVPPAGVRPPLALAPGVLGLDPPGAAGEGDDEAAAGGGGVVVAAVDEAGLHGVEAEDVGVEAVGAVDVVLGEGHLGAPAAA